MRPTPPLHARADVVGFPSFSQLELLVEQWTRRRRRAPPPPYAAARAAIAVVGRFDDSVDWWLAVRVLGSYCRCCVF